MEQFRVAKRRGKERKPLPSVEFLNECFTHDRVNGLLFWKERPASHFPTLKAALGWNGRFPGTEAGSKCCRPNGKHRYRDVGLKLAANGEAYLYSVHLLIWLMLGNEVPENCEVDHKDRDPWNNLEDNLRVATPTQNMQNAGGHKSKKSGLPKWVYKDKTCYQARLRVGEKVLFIGNFHDPIEAHLTTLKKAQELHGEFVNCGCDPQCSI